MSLYENIVLDMKEAMKNHNKELLSTIRMLKSDIDLYKINNSLDRINTPDEIVINIVSKQIKSYKENVIEFRNANREDLASKLEREIKILSKYLPEQLSEDEVLKVIDDIFDRLKPTSKADMKNIMSEAKKLLTGKADMKFVSGIVIDKLK